MGGSTFGKKFAKTTTKIVDPFGIAKTKFGKTVMKVVDPLNIMDPAGILPSSWAAGKTPFAFDKTYGGVAQKWLGINQPSSNYYPMKKGLSSNPEYFKQQQQNIMTKQNQMLQNMQSQNRAKLNTMRESSPTLAQSKISDTTSPADLPPQYKPMSMPQTAQLNAFQMPNMSNIKFGGV